MEDDLVGCVDPPACLLHHSASQGDNSHQHCFVGRPLWSDCNTSSLVWKCSVTVLTLYCKTIVLGGTTVLVQWGLGDGVLSSTVLNRAE